WHYSNLAYALLGQVVARIVGKPFREYVEERLLRPLGLRRTTWGFDPPHARPYFVEPYSDSVQREPELDLGGKGGESGLCSTVGDLGRWGSEGHEFVFSWRSGRLEARVATAPAERAPSAFEPDGEDRFRTVSGDERGELLRVVRGDGGEVVKLYWATYPFTRAPAAFGARSNPADA